MTRPLTARQVKKMRQLADLSNERLLDSTVAAVRKSGFELDQLLLHSAAFDARRDHNREGMGLPAGYAERGEPLIENLIQAYDALTAHLSEGLEGS